MWGHQALPMFQLYYSEYYGAPQWYLMHALLILWLWTRSLSKVTKVDISEVHAHFWGEICAERYQALHVLAILYWLAPHWYAMHMLLILFPWTKTLFATGKEHVDNNCRDFHYLKHIAIYYAFMMFNLCACNLAPHQCVMYVLLISWPWNEHLLGTGNRKCWPQTCGFPWPLTNCIDYN
jgi:hypothetical protein